MRIVIILFIVTFAAKTSGQSYNIESFGAIADGKTINTVAIQKTIDKAAVKGGTVIVPAGVFMTGTLVLKSNITLMLNKNAVLMGIADPKAYPAIAFDYPFRSGVTSGHGLIVASRQDNITITGEGTLDGNGGDPVFYIDEKNPNNRIRPNVLFLFGCRNLTVSGVAMRSSAAWMQHYLNCDFLRIQNINVFNHANLNNDGVDINDCHNVVVSGCVIDSDDDGLCFKSEGDRGVKNVVVTNCIISSHASAFKLGTGSIGGFEAIQFSNSIIRPSLAENLIHPFRLKGGIAGIDLASVDGAKLKNVFVSGLCIDSVETPFFIKLGKRMDRTSATPVGKKGVVEDIYISHVSVSHAGAITSSVTGYPGAYANNISFSDIVIEHTTEVSPKDTSMGVPENADQYPVNRMFNRKKLPASGFYVRHVKNIRFNNINIRMLHKELRPAIVLEDVQDAAVSGLDYQTFSPMRVNLSAVASRHISLCCWPEQEKNIRLVQSSDIVVNGKSL